MEGGKGLDETVLTSGVFLRRKKEEEEEEEEQEEEEE